MSTTYYLLAKPITSVRVSSRPFEYAKVQVFINHYLSGSLILRNSELPSILLALADRRGVGAAKAYDRGDVQGAILEKYMRISPEDQLVSEYGDLTTLEEIRSKE